jgi:hypothetical protein
MTQRSLDAGVMTAKLATTDAAESQGTTESRETMLTISQPVLAFFHSH